MDPQALMKLLRFNSKRSLVERAAQLYGDLRIEDGLTQSMMSLAWTEIGIAAKWSVNIIMAANEPEEA